MRNNLPNKSLFIGAEIPGHPHLHIEQHVASGNNGHVFRVKNTEIRRDFACKIVPWSNLVTTEDKNHNWRSEIERANSLPGSIAVRFVDTFVWDDGPAGGKYLVLLSEYIVGKNLKQVIDKSKSEVTLPFIQEFLETMLDFLRELEDVGIQHGDLHCGNILVQDRSASLRGPRYEFRVTDFGVAAVTSQDTSFKDDYFQLAAILRELLALIRYQELEPRDQYIFNALRNQFANKILVERDNTIASLARNPREIYQYLISLPREYEKVSLGSQAMLVTPFDFLSCEQIGDVPAILHALYSDLFLGIEDIQSRNNAVVTGPRGCGKSTVFKNLSLRQRFRIQDADPKQINYFGIYYHCNDLYFSFPRYVLPENDNGIDIPVQFLISTLIAELLDDIARWSEEYFRDDFAKLESECVKKIWHIIDLQPPKEPGALTIRALQSALQKLRRRAVFEQRNVHKVDFSPSEYLKLNSLHEVADELQRSLPFLDKKPFYFFIDDYSIPKVTKDLQSNLNRLLMQRSHSCFFKLSTESPVSFSSRDIDGKEYVESREYALLNLGQIYLRDDSQRKLAFIEDVFKRRLSAASNFSAKNIETLLGSNSRQNSNDDARQIRQKSRIQHWGKETLSNLCSGDIHYIINLVRTMVTSPEGLRSLGETDKVPRIPAKLQDKAIRDEAGKFLRNLSGCCEHGERLVSIVSVFGKVASSYLKYRTSKNESGEPPYQASRLEPYEQLDLTPEAQEIYHELLRYSVFIEDYRGKSRRGDVVPRLFLRRFLIPHFNLTFSTRDSIQVEPSDFEDLLTNSARFEQRLRMKDPEEAGTDELKLEWNSEKK